MTPRTKPHSHSKYTGPKPDRKLEVLTATHKGMPEHERVILDTQVNQVAKQVHTLGNKGALELLGKLGMWIADQDAPSRPD